MFVDSFSPSHVLKPEMHLFGYGGGRCFQHTLQSSLSYTLSTRYLQACNAQCIFAPPLSYCKYSTQNHHSHKGSIIACSSTGDKCRWPSSLSSSGRSSLHLGQSFLVRYPFQKHRTAESTEGSPCTNGEGTCPKRISHTAASDALSRKQSGLCPVLSA